MSTRQRQSMQGVRQALFVLLLLGSWLFPRFAASVRAQSSDYRLEPALTSSVGLQLSSLRASGSLLVWEDRRNGTPDIYAYDLDDAREFRPDRSPGARSQPAVSGTRVIWVSGSDSSRATIVGTDIATGATFMITEQPGPVEQPAIDGSLVAWREVRGDRGQIRVKDLQTGQSYDLAQGDANQANPVISGQFVLWQEFRNGSWDLVLWDHQSGAITPVVTSPDDETDPVIAGDWI
ncbi:MAG: TolB family protein, partial [Thermomicrobium sp.]